MKCIKCNEELAEATSFCRHCGQDQNVARTESNEGETEFVSNDLNSENQFAGLNLEENATNSTNLANKNTSGNQFNNKKMYTIAGCIAGVCLVAGVAFATLMSNPKTVVSTAFYNTYSGIKSEHTKILEELEIYNHFKDFYTGGKYEIDFGDDYYEMKLVSDYKNKQLKASTEIYGIEGAIYFSEKYATFECDALRDVYGINFETFNSDIENFEVMPIDLPKNYELPIFKEVNNDISVEIEKIIKSHMIEFYKEVEVEEKGNTNVKSDGKTVSADVYSIEIPYNVLEDMLFDINKEVFKNKKVIEYFGENIEIYNDMLDAMSKYTYISRSSYLTDIDELEDIFEDVIEELVEILEDNVDSIEVAVYNKKIAEIIISENRNDLIIGFNTGKNILESIYLEDDYNEMNYSLVYEDDVLEFEFSVDDESISIEYDTSSKKNNFKIGIDGYYEKISVDTSTKNTVKISVDLYGEEFFINSVKNSLDKNWFDQSKDYENILEYSISDFEKEISKILMNSLW